MNIVSVHWENMNVKGNYVIIFVVMKWLVKKNVLVMYIGLTQGILNK